MEWMEFLLDRYCCCSSLISPTITTLFLGSAVEGIFMCSSCCLHIIGYNRFALVVTLYTVRANYEPQYLEVATSTGTIGWHN